MITQACIDFRKTRIGGSDIAPILGKSPYGGQATVAQRMLGVGINQTTYKAEFEFGNRWEASVAKLFAENHPEYYVVSLKDAYQDGLLDQLTGFDARIIELEDGTITVLDKELDFAVLNTDFLLISRLGLGWGVLEIKTSSEYAADNWGDTGSSDIPVHYEDQPKWYTSRLGGDFAFLACLIGQRDYREYSVSTYTIEEEEQVKADICDFYQRYIVEEQPVPPTFCDIGNLNITADYLEVDEQMLDAIKQHKYLDVQISALKKEQESIDKKLRALAEDREGFSLNGKPLFTHTSKEALIFDLDELKRHQPQIYARYQKPVVKKRFAKARGYKELDTGSIQDSIDSEWRVA